MRKVRTLVVDDSAVVRRTVSEILESDPHISVIGAAPDPYAAAQKIRKEIPDVIVLDIEMPRMDGLTFLRTLMAQMPVPVVICSSLTGAGSDAGFRALEYGAVEVIEKPRADTKRFLEESRVLLCDAVKAASMVRPDRAASRAASRPAPHLMEISPKLTADAVLGRPGKAAAGPPTEKVVVVGASTGGTEAVQVFLQGLPADAPGVVVVQHMPRHFTAAFARRLDSVCGISVREAADGDQLMRGLALIAPGDRHTLLARTGGRYRVEVKDGPLVCRHRPSVDVLFRSAAKYAGKNAVGVIMTGMGDDGARGMLEMREAGAYTIAQDEATSVVYGMPQEAVKLGGVIRQAPLGDIAAEVVRACAEAAHACPPAWRAGG